MENLSAISLQVSVVVLIFNQDHLTERLQSLQANTQSNYEVIVVNNASTDHSATLLQIMQLLFPQQQVPFQIISYQQLALLNNDT